MKPNAYCIVDWMWILGKFEKRFLGWSFRWLSRVGRLDLIKSVLKSLPIFSMSLSWIPKGILEQIHKVFFAYLWRGSVDHQVMAWVRWERIAIPKALRGWGLKTSLFLQKLWLIRFLETYTH